MDASNIVFDPRDCFKTRQDEQPFLNALKAYSCRDNLQSPKEIESHFQLPRNSFLSYVKWKREPVVLPPTAVKKRKVPPKEVPDAKPEVPAPICISNTEPVLTEEELKSIVKCSDEASFSANLYSAAQHALCIKLEASITLWKATEIVAASAEYHHKQRTIFECARKIVNNPSYYPSQVKEILRQRSIVC